MLGLLITLVVLYNTFIVINIHFGTNYDFIVPAHLPWSIFFSSPNWVWRRWFDLEMSVCIESWVLWCLSKVMSVSRQMCVPDETLSSPHFPCGLRLTSTVFTAALHTALHYTLNHLKDLKHQKVPLQLILPDCLDHLQRARPSTYSSIWFQCVVIFMLESIVLKHVLNDTLTA